ncbi:MULTISPECIES: RtcB family protein [Thermodesulfovibrio]|jgi:tRNA-splicing ligase RtcB|uniref:RtcB family protein n=1 Tax=Thermodesulfovibrio TaxID=28261 RepID=UPI00263345BE|nr:RtcB family protein [Thermodesulfovibrio sp.]
MPKIDGTVRIDPYRIKVPKGFVEGMKTEGLIFLDQVLEEELELDSVRQVANVATLPGIVGKSLAMPDIHTGYGFPIGGVAAFDTEEGVISPGGVGYDINCGVRLLKSNLTREEVEPKLRELIDILYNHIPSGVGSTGKIKLSTKDEKEVVRKGAIWAVEQGFGGAEDLERIESHGCLEGADPDAISPKAYERGRSQQGTLGSGNHFLEIQYVAEVYEPSIAEAMGLWKGQLTVMIHTGSRGFGHQICDDYIRVMLQAAKKYGIELPDKELACVPFRSREGQQYFAAMKGAANYAWANRQCLMHWTREVFLRVFKLSPRDLGMTVVFDVAHNIAKEEFHTVDGKRKRLIVHRKGATRAFPKGHPELPDCYKEIGQPVLIPGDMGRASFVLVGLPRAMEETFGSTCHGAGRLLSRNQAIKQAKGRSIKQELAERGIVVRSAGKETLAEEMPDAYKDVSNVVDVVHNAGIAMKVLKLKPMGVIKG